MQLRNVMWLFKDEELVALAARAQGVRENLVPEGHDDAEFVGLIAAFREEAAKRRGMIRLNQDGTFTYLGAVTG